MIQVLERAKSDHRKIQYASSKVPLKLWREGWIRQSTIYPHIYVWIEAKERSTNAKNVRNRPGEYTLDDTGLGTGKIRPQEDSIRLLKGTTQTMAVRLAQTVNNMPVDICMYWGKGAEHRHQQHKELTRRIHPQWYRSWNGQNLTTGRLDMPLQRSHSNHWSALGLEIWKICPQIWLYQEGMEIIWLLLFLLVEIICCSCLFLVGFTWSNQSNLEVYSSSFF